MLVAAGYQRRTTVGQAAQRRRPRACTKASSRSLPVSAFHQPVLGPGICSMPVSLQVQNWGPATQQRPLDPACTEETRQADREITRATGLPTQARNNGRNLYLLMTACTRMIRILGFGLRKSWLTSHNSNCLDSVDSISPLADATTFCQRSQERCCHSPSWLSLASKSPEHCL